MKVKMYSDIFTGLDPATCAIFATSKPGQKCEGLNRIAFTIDIPDYLLIAVDTELPMQAKIEDIQK